MSSIFEVRLPHPNCGQSGKMAVASSVQSNAEDHKIPNPSLTASGPQKSHIRQCAIEIERNLHYNKL